MSENNSNNVVTVTIHVDVQNVGHITNCYLVYDDLTKNGCIIDPGFNEDKILGEIDKRGINVRYIILTHCHADHIGALEVVQNLTNANIAIHEYDYDGLADFEKNHGHKFMMKEQNYIKEKVKFVTDKEKLILDDIDFEIIHTPGHTAGCICLFEKTSNKLFTGDTLFADCYGRTDLKSGSIEDMKLSLKKLFVRFSNIDIFPGHDEIKNIDQVKRKINLLLKVRGH